jgi:periplasmic copper chaperone A
LPHTQRDLIDMTTTSSRRTALTFTGIALGGALAIGVPMAASAHVHAHADGAAAGATSRVELSFSHGCDDAPTTALVVDIPEGADNATPVVDGAWTISREVGDDGVPTQITYTAVEPIDTAFAASVSMDVLFGADTGGTDVAFPVTQVCETGETAWVELAEEGQDPHDLEAPAPTVAVAEADAAAADEHGEHAEGETTDAAAETAAPDVAPYWLGGGALVLSAAALVVALVRRRA